MSAEDTNEAVGIAKAMLPDVGDRETVSIGQGTRDIGLFITTRWTTVQCAGDPARPSAAEALERLCSVYWYPLYFYVRRQGTDEDSAKDLIQGFFARLLERNSLAQVQRDKGRFRSFLLRALTNFMDDERHKMRSAKRGGKSLFVPLESSEGENLCGLEPADDTDPGKLYDRHWALTLLEQARRQLEKEYHDKGNVLQYERLMPYVSGSSPVPSYSAVAAELGLSQSAVRSAAFRMRMRFHELVRQQVAQTVPNPEDVDAEIRHLISVLSG